MNLAAPNYDRPRPRPAGRAGPDAGLVFALGLLDAVQHRPSFDWPCACGHRSDQCTKREDGTCDG